MGTGRDRPAGPGLVVDYDWNYIEANRIDSTAA
jgi:hypothetical protein